MYSFKGMIFSILIFVMAREGMLLSLSPNPVSGADGLAQNLTNGKFLQFEDLDLWRSAIESGELIPIEGGNLTEGISNIMSFVMMSLVVVPWFVAFALRGVSGRDAKLSGALRSDFLQESPALDRRNAMEESTYWRFIFMTALVQVAALWGLMYGFGVIRGPDNNDADIANHLQQYPFWKYFYIPDGEPTMTASKIAMMLGGDGALTASFLEATKRANQFFS